VNEVDAPARPETVPDDTNGRGSGSRRGERGGRGGRGSFADRWPFRRKLTILVGAPLIVILLLLTYVITGLIDQARDAASAAQLVRDSRQVAELVDRVETEHQQAILLSVRYESATTGTRPSLVAYRQARAVVDQARASFFPTVQGGFTATRARNAIGTIATPTVLPQENPYYNLYTAQLSVSYLPDVFGATRRSVEAARAQAESSRFQLEATYLTLSSNVVATAIQEASLRGQIAATDRLLDLQHQLTVTVRQQQTLGTVSQSANDAEPAKATALAEFTGRMERHPKRRGIAWCEFKVTGENTHDRDGLAVEANGCANDIAPRTKFGAPECIAEDDQVRAVGLVFTVNENTAERGLNTERGEKIRCDACG